MKTLIGLVLIPLVVFAQPQETKYIVVKGSAEVRVPVDYMLIAVSIPTYSSSITVARDSNRATVLRMMETLRRYAVADSDFQTSDNSSRQDINAREPEHRYIITYTAQFTLRNVLSYDSLFQELLSKGNIDVSVRGNGSNKNALYKALAYQKAFKAARHEAEVLLSSTHQSPGKLIKLIQDSRDVFTQYDDIDQLAQRVAKSPQASVSSYSSFSQITAERVFHRDYYTQNAEVTAIYEIR